MDLGKTKSGLQCLLLRTFLLSHDMFDWLKWMISLQTGNCSNVLSRSPNWAAALTFHTLRLFGTWLRNLTANKMGSRLVPWQCCSCYVKIGDSHSYSLRHYRGQSQSLHGYIQSAAWVENCQNHSHCGSLRVWKSVGKVESQVPFRVSMRFSTKCVSWLTLTLAQHDR